MKTNLEYTKQISEDLRIDIETTVSDSVNVFVRVKGEEAVIISLDDVIVMGQIAKAFKDALAEFEKIDNQLLTVTP